MSTVELFESYS